MRKETKRVLLFVGAQGFSLVELMAVLFIFCLLLTAIFAVLTSGRRSWEVGTAQVEVQQEARRAVDSMIRQLREASAVDPATFVNGVSDDILRFTVAGLNTEFAINVAGFNPDQLVMTQAGVTGILANNVADIQFTLSGGNVIYISLTAQKRTSGGYPTAAVLNSQVILRN